MKAKCANCGLVINTQEKDDFIIISETERLPKKLFTENKILKCPCCGKIMEIEE